MFHSEDIDIINDNANNYCNPLIALADMLSYGSNVRAYILPLSRISVVKNELNADTSSRNFVIKVSEILRRRSKCPILLYDNAARVPCAY